MFTVLLFFTIALVSLEVVVDTVSKDRVPAPSVINACPDVPSAVGKLNVVPPDLMIILEPSDLMDSLVSTNCISLFVPKMTASLNVAAPAPAKSILKALINDPPSLPLNTIPLSDT